MSYSNWHEIFTNKVKGYDSNACHHALRDCHETLALYRDMDNPYCVKLWAEVDALRERQLILSKVKGAKHENL